jgi:hypothetical protein
MTRTWVLAGLVVAAATVCALLVGFVGTTTLLTMSLPIGAGTVGAYLAGDGFISRGGWLFGGVLLGSLGFVLGAAAFPDTAVGLWLGAVVPVVLLALLTMWSRKESNLLTGLLGIGAITGVYATTFNADPQSINVSLPIAIGQTVFPLGLGYLAGTVARLLLPASPPGTPEQARGEGGPGDADPAHESPARPSDQGTDQVAGQDTGPVPAGVGATSPAPGNGREGSGDVR